MSGKHAVGDIRNLALVGHGAAGKTSLADALLFKAGAVTRRGSVDDGTSYSDYDDEEHKRHFSIDTSVLHADHDGKYLEILDAPGYPDFVGAAPELSMRRRTPSSSSMPVTASRSILAGCSARRLTAGWAAWSSSTSSIPTTSNSSNCSATCSKHSASNACCSTPRSASGRNSPALST